jgi:hypothetical protein
MRDQVTKPQEPTQAERLQVPFQWDGWRKPVADRVLAHVMKHRPPNVEALRRLFKPHWKVSNFDLVVRISLAPRWKAAGITVTEKGVLSYPTNSFLEDKPQDMRSPDAKPVGYEAFDEQVGDRAPPRKRIAPPPPRPAPPPPEPEPELKPPPAWLEDGDAPPLTETQRMRRRRQNSEVAILEKIRGCKLDIDRTRLYTGDVLSQELDISVDEYMQFASQPWGRKKSEFQFPRSFRPPGIDKKKLAALRQKFHRDQKKAREDTMLNLQAPGEVRTRPRITRTEAVVNACPPPPEWVKRSVVVNKLRKHETCRGLSPGYVKDQVRSITDALAAAKQINMKMVTEGGTVVCYLQRSAPP